MFPLNLLRIPLNLFVKLLQAPGAGNQPEVEEGVEGIGRVAEEEGVVEVVVVVKVVVVVVGGRGGGLINKAV